MKGEEGLWLRHHHRLASTSSWLRVTQGFPPLKDRDLFFGQEPVADAVNAAPGRGETRGVRSEQEARKLSENPEVPASAGASTGDVAMSDAKWQFNLGCFDEFDPGAGAWAEADEAAFQGGASNASASGASLAATGAAGAGAGAVSASASPAPSQAAPAPVAKRPKPASSNAPSRGAPDAALTAVGTPTAWSREALKAHLVAGLAAKGLQAKVRMKVHRTMYESLTVHEGVLFSTQLFKGFLAGGGTLQCVVRTWRVQWYAAGVEAQVDFKLYYTVQPGDWCEAKLIAKHDGKKCDVCNGAVKAVCPPCLGKVQRLQSGELVSELGGESVRVVFEAGYFKVLKKRSRDAGTTASFGALHPAPGDAWTAFDTTFKAREAEVRESAEATQVRIGISAGV